MFHFLHFFIFGSNFVFRLGIFVPLDLCSSARCARAPQLAQSWDCFLSAFAGNIEGIVFYIRFHLTELYAVICWQIGTIAPNFSAPPTHTGCF